VDEGELFWKKENFVGKDFNFKGEDLKFQPPTIHSNNNENMVELK